VCVILEKIANAEIPYETLLAAAHRNSDGYGVVIPDGALSRIERGLTKEPEEAADKVAELLRDARDQLAFVHFRYRTVGAVDVGNTQPIQILGRSKGDQVDVVMMHNGTLGGFQDSFGRSDSHIFAESIVEPLLRRSAAFTGDDRVLEDPFVTDILGEYSGLTSKFALVDCGGNSLVINRGKGVELPFGWASNRYSLDPENITRKNEKEKKFYSVPNSNLKQNDKLKGQINDNKKMNVTSGKVCSPKIRSTVTEVTGFSLDDYTYLDPDQIREIIADYPDLGALLLMDYIYYYECNEREKYAAAA